MTRVRRRDGYSAKFLRAFRFSILGWEAAKEGGASTKLGLFFCLHFFPKEKRTRNCKRSVQQRGKSLLPAVIDYGAWRKGDAYVFNHRLGAPRGCTQKRTAKF
jgi:hypothetical protein